MVPPLVGVAVNVTLFPVQILVADAAIVTDGVTEEVTVIVMLLLVAVGGVLHEALLVITTFTTALLGRVVDEKVGLLVPAFTLFTFH